MKMDTLRMISCDVTHASEILTILNYAIEHSCDVYDYTPRTLADIERWIAQRRSSDLPFLGIVDETDTIRAFGTFAVFRPFEAYATTVEHSIYVAHNFRRKGLGRWMLTELVETASTQGRHCMIAGIDSQNSPSIQMHLQFGFEECGEMRQIARKFNRWLDLIFFQYLIPESPLRVFTEPDT